MTNRRRAILLLGLPCVMVLLLSTTVKCINYQRFGIYAKSLIHSPGLMSLMKALYRVKPQEDIPLAPVTRQSLRAACQASPTLKPYTERLLNSQAARQGEKITGVPGEFGSFLNWLLPQSLPSDRRLADRIMSQAAEEIDAALKTGELPSRRAHFPLDPRWRFWLPKLGFYFVRTWKDAFSMGAAEPWGSDLNPLLQFRFDEAANRRAASNKRMLLISGQLSDPNQKVDSVALVDLAGRWVGASGLFTNYFHTQRTFDLRVPFEGLLPTYQWVLLSQGERLHTVELRLAPDLSTSLDPSMAAGSNTTYLLANPRDHGCVEGVHGDISYRIELHGGQSQKMARKEVCEQELVYLYATLVYACLFLLLIRVLLGTPWEPARLRHATIGLVLILGLIAGRCCLYTLLDANTGWSCGYRYMRCISPVSVMLFFLGAMVLAAWARRWMDRSQP